MLAQSVTSSSAVRRPDCLLSGIRAFDLTPKSLDQSAEAGLARRNAGELLGVIDRGPKIPGIAAIADERQQRIAVAGMAGEALLENRHGVLDVPGRVQPDGVDIRVSCSVGIEFGGTAQFAECLFASLEPGEREAKRVMQPRILR